MKLKFTLSILGVLILLFISFLGGLRWGFNKGVDATTFAYNYVKNIPPYDSSLKINNIEYKNISASGFDCAFTTDEKYDLIFEYGIFPSDIYTGGACESANGYNHSFHVKTYPEGGTVIYRVKENSTEDIIKNHGTEWIEVELPRPEGADNILMPPYK